MACDAALRTQAYFDGEVDAVSAAGIEAHLDGCEECRGLLQDLSQLRAGLRHDIGFVRAPVALHDRVRAALEREMAGDAAAPVRTSDASSVSARPAVGAPPVTGAPPLRRRGTRRHFWSGALAGVSGSALAAGLAFFLLVPPRMNEELDGLVGAHLRSMTPDHLIEVVSTDRHTVKPWFASHADVSPVVADFESKGFRLVGGRSDYLNEQRAAVTVYQHGAHVINVFAWANDRLAAPRDSMRNGFHMAFWQQGNLTYCAVSDAEWKSVLELKGLLQDLGKVDANG